MWFGAWGYCRSPLESTTPEQINLQHSGQPERVVVSFVTFGECRSGSAKGVVSTEKSLQGGEEVEGLTFEYVEPGRKKRRYWMHFVVFSGLQARTKYYYKVKGGCTEYSDIQAFKSLYYGGNTQLPTKFAIFGDMGVYAYNNMGNLERDLDAGKIDAIVHLGDHAYNLADADGGRGDGYLNAFSRILQSE